MANELKIIGDVLAEYMTAGALRQAFITQPVKVEISVPDGVLLLPRPKPRTAWLYLQQRASMGNKHIPTVPCRRLSSAMTTLRCFALKVWHLATHDRLRPSRYQRCATCMRSPFWTPQP